MKEIKLSEYISSSIKEDDLVKIFINMDSSMHYLHDNGFIISSFNLEDIFLSENGMVRFKYSEFINKDFDIRENIYNLVFLEISLLTGTVDKLNDNFLKTHIDDFMPILPEEFSPYYKVIINNRSNLYMGEYLANKKKMDLQKLMSDLGEEKDIDVSKTIKKDYLEISKIYSFGLGRRASINVHAYPIILLILLIFIVVVFIYFIWYK